MAHAIAQNVNIPFLRADTKRILVLLSTAFVLIAGLTVLQDLAESIRRGYTFHLTESLLFKTIWFLFVPILTILYRRLAHENLGSTRTTILYIVAAILIHFLFIVLVGYVFSNLFFEGRYGLYKFFSFTLAQDFYKLVVVYTVFVLGYKILQKNLRITPSPENRVSEKIVISNGKNKTIVCVEEIIQITSATPYIFIHVENKRYLYTETLKSISQQLDGNIFIRVHKTAVVNIEKVKSFKSRLNGDYDLALKNGESVRLSRTYAANFKTLFKRGTQDTV